MSKAKIKVGGLTQQELMSFLNYDQNTGLFTWIKKPPRYKSSLKSINSADKNGYLRVSIGRKCYRLSRLAFLYMTGKFPDEQVDHINGINTDDRWSNLREATRSQNIHNTKRFKSNTSGIKGVNFNKNCNKWEVRVMVNRKRIYGGMYNSLRQAKEVREKMAIKYHGEFVRHE